MAPNQPVRSEKDKRIKAILAFTSELEKLLPTSITARTAPELLLRVEEHLKQFNHLPTKSNAATAARSEDLDRQGTTLWNSCTRLRRQFDSGKPDEVPTLLVVARVLAFFLLDHAYAIGRNGAGNFARLMKIGIKAAKGALEHKDLDLALRALEKVAFYEELLTDSTKAAAIPQEDRVACEPLIGEYYVLRIAQSWQQENYPLTNHLLKKIKNLQPPININTAEGLADVLYEIGKKLLDKGVYKEALTWLDRSFTVLDGQQLDRITSDANELRVAIIQSTVKALLGLATFEHVERARTLVGQLEHERGEKLVVLLLKLELLSVSPDESFDAQGYSDVLRRMTLTVILSDDNFKLLLFHIRKLTAKNSHLGCVALDQLLKFRVLKEGKIEQVERILITRLHITTGQSDPEREIATLTQLWTSTYTSIGTPISAAASLGAHSLLWKRIESAIAQKQFDTAEQWCRLALHEIFATSGEVNLARISRKCLLCALERQDIGTAREIFGSMSDTVKNQAITRFLMYKIALRCNEAELAAECLQIISASSSEDPTLLYACCLDAKEAGSTRQSLDAFQLAIEKYGYGDTKAIHLPSLLRSSIGLLLPLIDKSKHPEGSGENEIDVNKLCIMFEGAAQALQKSKPSKSTNDTLWTVLELDWFSKNSYNIAIKHVSDFNPRHTLRILQACIKFIDHYPEDIGEQVAADLAFRKMFCDFTSATALITLARSEDNIELQLQQYLQLRKHVESFDNVLQGLIAGMGEVLAEDFLRKLAILMAFDFEAACQLKAWDSLSEIILKSAICRSMRVYQLMADCLLSVQAPTRDVLSNLKRIVNAAWGLNNFDTVRLAKYMRCLFQIAIPDNEDVAEELLNQIQAQAEQAVETGQPYPHLELEWIATTSFNHAVDLFIAEKDDQARDWTFKAINLAHFCADGGALEGLLREKLVGLKLDG